MNRTRTLYGLQQQPEADHATCSTAHILRTDVRRDNSEML